MKTLIYLFILTILVTVSLQAQDGFDQVLAEIDKNNTSLIALKQQAEANKMNSRTGIYLQNPEVGFNYLWGSPDRIGNRVDFSVSQSFDFPSAYSHRNNIANLQESQADIKYRLERTGILLEAKQICIELVYYNGLMEENKKLMEYATNISEAVGKMYEGGETGILDYNKAQLNLNNIKTNHTYLETEAQGLHAELRRLNGGNEIDVELLKYSVVNIPEDFDTWFASAEQSNPILQYLNKQVEISEYEEKLNRALSLPKFSAGYMSEAVIGDQFQGVMVGMSIPLWENKNTVKAAKAQTVANLALASDSYLQLYNELKIHHRKAINLMKSSDGYFASINSVNTTELLKKAFDMGEISLIEYLVEVQFYYDILIKAMETRREMQLELAELEKWSW